MVKLEEFSVVKLKEDQLFTVVGGQKQTTYSTSGGTSGKDLVLNDKHTTQFWDANDQPVEWLERDNDWNL